MSTCAEHGSRWRRQVRVALVVAKKDVLIYYLKPPVIVFGIVLPVFLFLAFAVGRPLPIEQMVPGMVAMALFFTASAVGPLVTPWERQFKTYERLVTSPASTEALLGGDVLAGMAFGVVLSAMPLLLGVGATAANIAAFGPVACGVVLGALTFASLGVLLASPATDAPSQILMLSNLTRLPLIFISGVFVPIPQMPVLTRCLAPLSPLSYCVDLIRVGFGEPHYFPLWVDAAALLGFAFAFLTAARYWHLRSRQRGR